VDGLDSITLVSLVTTSSAMAEHSDRHGFGNQLLRYRSWISSTHTYTVKALTRRIISRSVEHGYGLDAGQRHYGADCSNRSYGDGLKHNQLST
jgi:hypothetical protein